MATSVRHGLCLVCGEVAPPSGEGACQRETARLRSLGWERWRSEPGAPAPAEPRPVVSICPGCRPFPARVARAVIARHGLGTMVDWLRHWRSPR